MVRISSIMLAEVPALKKEAKIGEAAKLLSREEISCVVVTDGSKPIGILTGYDILVNAMPNGKITDKPVSAIISTPLIFMTPQTKLDEALKIIDTKRFRRYPVIENDKLVGIVTKTDIITKISENVRLHRNIQNIVLVIFVLFEFFVFLLSSHIKFGA